MYTLAFIHLPQIKILLQHSSFLYYIRESVKKIRYVQTNGPHKTQGSLIANQDYDKEQPSLYYCVPPMMMMICAETVMSERWQEHKNPLLT